MRRIERGEATTKGMAAEYATPPAPLRANVVARAHFAKGNATPADSAPLGTERTGEPLSRRMQANEEIPYHTRPLGRPAAGMLPCAPPPTCLLPLHS